MQSSRYRIQHVFSTLGQMLLAARTQRKSRQRLALTASCNSGEDRIRTCGTELPVHRFSKPALSTTQPPPRFDLGWPLEPEDSLACAFCRIKAWVSSRPDAAGRHS